MLRSVKKVCAAALAGVLALTLAVPAVAPVQALEYEGSASYMSGRFYRQLTDVALTGDQRVDIVNVALSQVGYQEGGTSTQLSGEVLGGVNFTEFGRWYGMQDMWCAMFASWCAHVAGISTDVVPSHSYTPNGLSWFKKRGQAHSQEEVASGTYVPQSGDLIYFRSSRNTNGTNHVGIVTGCANGMIYTVEGNIGASATYSNGGMVTTVSYPITNTYIVAVCSPAYESIIADVAKDRLEPLRQVIATVEGSAYDRVDDAYGDAISVGMGQWYGNRAKALLQQIREADEAAFDRLDTAGVAEDLEKDWSRYSPNVQKKACIRGILRSDSGIRVQDRLLEQQLSEHLQEASELETQDEAAVQLYALLRHLGGAATARRVLDRVEGDVTAEAIVDAMTAPDTRRLHSAADMLLQLLEN